jgi:anaerobic selenocysteine-containing dehydrogenase
MKPLHDTRATPDVLLDVASKLKTPIKPELTWKTFDQMLQAAAGEDQWPTAIKQGWIELKGSGQPSASRPQSSEGQRRQMADPQFDGDPGQYPFYFLPYPSQAFLDGSLAHLPWLQEMPDPITTAMWSCWVEINPQTAAKLGISDGDVVEIGSTQGSVHVPALLSPGIAPDVLAMPVGQGHQSFTRYASGRGANPISLLAAKTEPETGALAWAATRVKLTRVGAPDGRLIRFAGSLGEPMLPR